MDDRLYKILKDTIKCQIEFVRDANDVGCIRWSPESHMTIDIFNNYCKYMKLYDYSMYLDNNNNWEVTDFGKEYIKKYEIEEEYKQRQLKYSENKLTTSTIINNISHNSGNIQNATTSSNMNNTSSSPSIFSKIFKCIGGILAKIFLQNHNNS